MPYMHVDIIFMYLLFFSGPNQSTDAVHKEKENKEYSDDPIGIIIGALAALILLLVIVIIIFFIRHKRRKSNNNRRSLKPVVDRHVTINLNDLRGSTNGKVSNGNMYNSIATEDTDAVLRKLAGPRRNEHSDFHVSPQSATASLKTQP